MLIFKGQICKPLSSSFAFIYVCIFPTCENESSMTKAVCSFRKFINAAT